MAKIEFPAGRQSPKATVFRALATILENDPVISRLVRPNSLRSWKGLPTDSIEFGIAQAPAIRLTPAPGEQSWYSPESQTGSLVVAVEVVTAGWDVSQPENLWYSIERAFYPAGQGETSTIADILQAAGGWSCMVEFMPPAFAPMADAGTGGGFYGMGQIRADYQKVLNT